MGLGNFLSSGFDYVADGISGLFGGGNDSVAKSVLSDIDINEDGKIGSNTFGDVISGNKSDSSSGNSFFGSLGSSLLSKEGIAGLLGAGNTYLSNSMQNDLQEQQYDRQREADKFKALLDFEKLKYTIGNKSSGGGGGGGSGGAAQNRATLISALASAKSGQSNALGNLSQTLGGIYGN